jgi:hypothetical protein
MVEPMPRLFELAESEKKLAEALPPGASLGKKIEPRDQCVVYSFSHEAFGDVGRVNMLRR